MKKIYLSPFIILNEMFSQDILNISEGDNFINNDSFLSN